MGDTAKLGAKLGPRVADLMAKAATSHLLSSADTRARIDLQGRLGVYRTITAETRTTVGPLFRELAEDPELPAYLRDTLRFLGLGSGELQAIVSALTTATSLTPGIGQLISNDLGPVIQNLIAKNPHALIDLGSAARAVASGVWSDDHGNLEAARSGTSSNRFETLVALAESQIDGASLLELLRRGEIDRHFVFNALRRQGYSGGHANELLKLARVHLSPADAADMVLRNIMSRAEGHAVAKVAGMDAADFDKLVLDTGEPPGTEELLFAYRRGIIDKSRLEHGIRQARTRDEWIDVIESLRFVPMNTGEAVAAVVQGHLSDAAGQKIAEENGLRPADWRPIVETHGRPPGTEQMIQLYRRRLISRARVEQAIRESDVKNKYIPDLIDLARHLLPERTVVSMHSKGALTDAQAMGHLLDLGVSREDATALVNEGTAVKTAGHKQLAEGTILSLYEAATISHAQAHAALTALGYTAQEIGWILSYADLRRIKAERDHAASTVRARYVAHHIDEQAASGYLDRLGVPATERDRLLPMWDLERAANVRQLTEAQVIRAMKKGAYSADDARAKLQTMGYSADDADTLIAIA